MRPRFWSSINKARPVLDTGLWGVHTVPIFSRRRYSRSCRSSRPPGADGLEPRLSSLQMAQALTQGFATPVFRLSAGQSRPRATTRGPPPAAPTAALRPRCPTPAAAALRPSRPNPEPAPCPYTSRFPTGESSQSHALFIPDHLHFHSARCPYPTIKPPKSERYRPLR